jgi:bifunctional UDP-N-acetylglucosamine pyrophosphorylase/glucosamine-1-phosphate N-acetyltransferase
MIIHVLEAAVQLDPDGLHVVFNPAVPAVKEACTGFSATWAEQAEQLGTGHAVQQALPKIPEDADVLVLYGDIPLLEASVLRELVTSSTDGVKVLTMRVPDPHGYGRIVRDENGDICAIVEQRDANELQQAICEVNSGIIMAPAAVLRSCLASMASKNAQKEYYLTDVIAIARGRGIRCTGVVAPVSSDLEGANDRVQLAKLEKRYQVKKTTELMQAGAQLADPDRLDIRGKVTVGQDVYIDVNVILEGDIELGDGVHIGPGCMLTNCQLAAGTRIHAYSVLEGVRSLGACDIGPFARLRPGTELGEGSRVGNFVEVKNSTLGAGTKASHLSYLGDASIGERVNIGAGTITCNYDGANKHRTVIEDDVFIGSDTQLVAPVTVGAGADIGAGSTVTKDAPAGQLTISRARQVTIRGWKRPTKKTK